MYSSLAEQTGLFVAAKFGISIDQGVLRLIRFGAKPSNRMNILEAITLTLPRLHEGPHLMQSRSSFTCSVPPSITRRGHYQEVMVDTNSLEYHANSILSVVRRQNRMFWNVAGRAIDFDLTEEKELGRIR